MPDGMGQEPNQQQTNGQDTLRDLILQDPDRYVQELRSVRQEAAGYRVELKNLGGTVEQLTQANERMQQEIAALKKPQPKGEGESEALAQLRAANDALQKDNEKLSGQLQSLQISDRRMRVAIEVGLPSDLWDRIRGDTEEEMKSDAETLKNLFAPAKSPGDAPSEEPSKADEEPKPEDPNPPQQRQPKPQTTTPVPGGEDDGTAARMRKYYPATGATNVFPAGEMVEP